MNTALSRLRYCGTGGRYRQKSLERQEVRQLLQEAVDGLPPLYREIFMLRDVEELNIAEAAEVLQVTTATVKVRLHRARIMLQKTLAPHLKTMTTPTVSQSKSRRGWFRWS